MAEQVTAWRPPIPGIVEVFHAHFTDHVYPMHAHDSWTLLIVDDGAVRYDLDRHEHGALGGEVTLLPPDVPHNGRSLSPNGFRKRVLYLRRDALGDNLIGSAVDSPTLPDRRLRERIHQLHRTLDRVGDELEAESRLALVCDHLRGCLSPADVAAARPDRSAARLLRDLLDSRIVLGLSMEEAAGLLHFHPTHLIRSFTREFGISPHQYLTSRRVDLARGLLLGGWSASEVALAAGFYDQSHFARHFRRVVGVNPGAFAGQKPKLRA